MKRVWREEKRERISFYWLDVVRPLYGGKRRGISHSVCGDFRKRKAFKKRPQRKLGEVGGSQKRQARSWCEIIPAMRILHTHRIRNVFMFLAGQSRGELEGPLARSQGFFSSASFVSDVSFSYSFHPLVLGVTQDNATQFSEAWVKSRALRWTDRREAWFEMESLYEIMFISSCLSV